MLKNRNLLIVGGILVVIVLAAISAYNRFVSLDEGVRAAWAEVENQYQRRSDLIPNLVEVVKGYAKHEQQTLTQVIEARAKATQTHLNINDLSDPQAFEKFQQAQSGLTGALSRLMVVVEKYPDLKANENFRDLQAQLEGTENRITVARKRYVEDVAVFNQAVRRFPGRLFASIFGFAPRETFKAEESAKIVPKVQF